MSAPIILLLSGGLDSTTLLALAKSQGLAVNALTFRYGQRHGVEIERAKQIERDVELDVRTKQIQQREKPANVTQLEQIPNEPEAFAEFVKQEAKIRGYRLVVKDLADKFSADTSIAKELRKFLREGDFTVDGETAKVTLKDVKDRGVFFKKAGERWFVEDRQIEIKPVEKAPEKKD